MKTQRKNNKKEYIKLSKINKLVFIIVLVLIISFIAVFFASIKNDSISFIETVSGISSFFVAILTAIYVYTTSRQIDVANKQLIEMQQERTLKEQPLLTSINNNFYIERPSFFYSPPENKFSFQSRYYFRAKVQNVSSYPAVAVDVDAEIEANKNGKISVLKAANSRLNIISPNSTVEFDIMFCNDNIMQLFESLRERDADLLPKLNVSITYRNLCGGFFKVSQSMYLTNTTKYEDVLRMWHSKISSAYIEEKERINELKRISSNEKYKELFEKIKNEFDSNLGDDKQITLECIDLPESFSLNVISKEEFESEIEKHYYGRYVHNTANCLKRK